MNDHDYVIVGAGSAGCVLAARLTEEAGVSVLLLEAGGPDTDPLIHMPLGFRKVWPDPRLTWGYESEPQPHMDNRRIPIPRGRVLGGSSSINALVYARGHRSDYDQWRQMGLEGWGYGDLLPYFKRSEGSWRGESAIHGGAGPVGVSSARWDDPFFAPFMAAAKASGLGVSEDIHADVQEGFTAGELTVKGGRRSSTANAYLRPARSRPGLTVATRALASRVRMEDGRAVGVEYRQGGETLTARAKREVILCGGAYNSPQLLMLSGVGPADELRAHGIEIVAERAEVGRNLQEHPNTGVEFTGSAPVSFDARLRFDRIAFSALRWALFKTGTAAGFPLSAYGFIRTRPELSRPDVECLVSPVSPEAHMWFPLIRAPKGHRFGVRITCLHPESRGHISLGSADPADKPRLFFNLLERDADRASLRGGIKAMRKLFATEPLASLVKAEVMPGPDVVTDDELDAFVRRQGATAHHPVATCRMGVDDASVVDPELRVRGVAGLRVVDASVMPTVPGGNTNMPTIMLAEKAADMILGHAPLPAEVI